MDIIVGQPFSDCNSNLHMTSLIKMEVVSVIWILCH